MTDGTAEGREIELKLELSCDDVARFAALKELGRRGSRPVRHSALYFDTAKDDLRKAGLSLRVRSARGRSVQTLKLGNGGGGALSSRPEWEWALDGDEPDLDLLGSTPAAPFVGSRRLRRRIAPRFEIRVARRTWTLSRGGSEIEIVLDEGEAVCGALSERICEVELELKKGGEEALFDLARTLGERVPLRLGVQSKAERGYRLNRPQKRRGPATKAEPLKLRPEMTVAQAFAAIVNACLRHFRLNEPWVERERNPEALHQARVAMRRLRSALGLFGPAIRDGDHDRLRDELRWFTGQLGEARNLDVFMKRLPNRRIGFGSKAENAVRAALESARQAAYDRVVEALRSQRLRVLMIDLAGWAEAGSWRASGKAGKPLDRFARKQVARRWKRVSEAGERLRGLDDERLHRLRIDIKKLRYASEFFSGLDGSDEETERRKAFVAALELLQDELGAINDMATAKELVAGLDLKSGSERRYAERLAARDSDPEKHMEAAEPAFERLLELAEE